MMMSKYAAIVVICACAVLGEQALAFSSEEAHRLYAERFKTRSASVVECGEYLFVINEGPLSKSKHDDHTAAVLEAQLGALEKHVGSGMFGYVSPFGTKLTDRLCARKVAFSIPSCRVVTVEESIGENEFREASAFELAPIKAERDRVMRREPSRRTVESWLQDLERLLSRCQTDAARRQIMAEAGMVVPLLFAAECACECLDISVDGRDVEWVFAKEPLSAATEDDCRTVLKVLPTYSRAHQRLAVFALDKDDFVECIHESLAVGMTGDVDERLFEAAMIKLHEWTGCGAWSEFAKLRKLELLSFETNGWNTSRVRSAVGCALGRVKFKKGRHESGDMDFREARNLYRRGKDLPRIISLLETAIEKNAENHEYWRYYGDALRTGGRFSEAAVAYQQAIALDESDCEAVMGLAQACERLGLKKLAASACWWGLIRFKNNESRAASIDMLGRSLPDVFL